MADFLSLARVGILSGLVAVLSLIWSLPPVYAQIWVSGRHQLALTSVLGEGDFREFVDGPVATGFRLDQQGSVRAFGREGGWAIDAAYQSDLPPEERLRLAAEGYGMRFAGGRIGVSGRLLAHSWSRQALGLAASGSVGDAHFAAAVGTPLGIPTSITLQGEGHRGPYAIGTGEAIPSTLDVRRDGVPLRLGFDYTFDADLMEITFVEPVPFTSLIEVSYAQVSPVRLGVAGLSGGAQYGPWGLSWLAASEQRLDQAADDGPAEIPDRVHATGWAVEQASTDDRPWSWGVAQVSTFAAWSDRGDAGSAQLLTGGYESPHSPWAVNVAYERRDPQFRPVSDAVERPEERSAASVTYTGERWRLGAEFEQARRAAGPSPGTDVWTLRQRIGWGRLNVDVWGGALSMAMPVPQTLPHGGASLVWNGGPYSFTWEERRHFPGAWPSHNRIERRKSTAKLVRQGEATRATTEWTATETQLAAGQREGRHTLSFRVDPARLDDGWRLLAMVTGREVGAEDDVGAVGAPFPTERAREAHLSASVTRPGQSAGERVTMRAALNGTWVQAAQVESGGSLSLAWERMQQDGRSHAWAVGAADPLRSSFRTWAMHHRRAWGAETGGALTAAAVLSEGGPPPRATVRVDLSRALSAAWTLRAGVTLGDVGELPHPESLHNAATGAPPVSGFALRTGAGWKASTWHLDLSVDHVWGAARKGSGERIDERRIKVDGMWRPTNDLELMLSQTVRTEFSPAGARHTSLARWTGAWWWNDQSQLGLVWERTMGRDDPAGKEGAVTLLKVQVETFF